MERTPVKNHLNEQVGQRGILALNRKALGHHVVGLSVLFIERSPVVGGQASDGTLHLQRRDAIVGIPVH